MNASHVLDDIVAAEALAPVHSRDQAWPADQKKQHSDDDDAAAGSVLSGTYAGSEILPTEEEQRTLRRVADHIPVSSNMTCRMEMRSCAHRHWISSQLGF